MMMMNAMIVLFPAGRKDDCDNDDDGNDDHDGDTFFCMEKR